MLQNIDPAIKYQNLFTGHSQPTDDGNSFLRDAVFSQAFS